jgi:hypothetical protein
MTYLPIKLVVLIAGMWLAACPAQAQDQTAIAFDGPVLVHRFTIPPGRAWGTITVDVAPAAWHVGQIDGPPATEAHVRAVMGRLAGIEVGGRCAGWVEGPTAYPCGFSVREFDLAGSVAQRFVGIVSDMTKPDTKRAQAAVDSRPPNAGALISPVLDVPRLVTLQLPRRYLGDKSKVIGGQLRFEIRAVSNPLVPSEFDHSSGVVTLRGGPHRASV